MPAARPTGRSGTHYTTRHRDAADDCPGKGFACDIPRHRPRGDPVPKPAAAPLQPAGPSRAEAIAVNGQRIVPNTAFHYAGVNILVNNASRLSSPYTVTALGDPSSLSGGIGNPDQLAELKSRSRIYRLGFSWLRSPRLSLPAFDTTFLVKYAQPIG